MNLSIVSDIKNKIEILYDAEKINEEAVSDLFKFFFYGYDNVSSEIQSLVDSIDFSPLGSAFNASSYQGLTYAHPVTSSTVTLSSDINLTNIVKSQMDTSSMTPFEIAELINNAQNGDPVAELKESEIDEYMGTGYSSIYEIVSMNATGTKLLH